MKKLLFILATVVLAGCSDKKVVLNDHKPQIDDHEARIILLEANDSVQDLRLNSLEVRVTDLEARMDQAESDIIANTDLIISLTDNLSDEIEDLRDELYDNVLQLRRADRRNKARLMRKIARLNQKLNREVRDLEDADEALQDQIDDLSSDLTVLANRFYAFRAQTQTSLFFLGLSIAILADQIDDRLDDIEDDVAVNAADIAAIQSDVSQLQSDMSAANTAIANLQSQLNDVESRLVSVVYPCGEGNSEEVLLQTQDGLVAYFQETRNKTLNFSDSITIPEYDIPAHTDKYCVDTNFLNGECKEFDYRYVGAHTIPEQSFNVGDTATVKVLKKAYLDVLADGNYRTTDGYSCNFTISNGEVQ